MNVTYRQSINMIYRSVFLVIVPRELCRPCVQNISHNGVSLSDTDS